MNRELLIKELQFRAIRSSGPGGQHVNKTSSRVELSFHIANSEALTEAEKQRLAKRLASRISKEGNLVLQCSETRSQHRNKAIVIERLWALLKTHLRVSKPRKKTRPPKRVIEKRLKAKKNQALKKANRKPPKTD